MKPFRSAWLRLRSLWRRRLDRDLEDEFDFHMEMAAQEYIDAGMSRDRARLKVRQDFGNRTGLKEAGREMFTFTGIETILQDIRYGLRVLIKNPGFSSAVVVTLALGIGVNVAIFSLVYGVLMRPLPYQAGDRLVVLHQQAKRNNVAEVPFSVKEILDYRQGSHTLDAVVEHHTMNFLLLNGDSAERVDTAVVSANFFDVLGVRPLLGRTFVAADEAHGADAVLVLSYEYWKGRHGGEPGIVGRVFQMNNRPHTVIGVLPPIPQYPVANDVYMPTSQCPTRSSAAFIENRQSRMMTAFGKLKADVPLEQAQSDLSVIARQLEQSYPDVYPPGVEYRLAVAPLREDLTRRAHSTFLVLLVAAGLVLLIACANVANLLASRLVKLRGELALRGALGASTIRLVRQLLTESLLLSCAGGALGLALVPATLRLLMKFAERFTTRAAEVRVDAPVLIFAFAVSLVAGILFGLWPAVSSRSSVSDALKRGAAARSTEGAASRRLRSGLVVTQVAVSFILLIGAGLMIRSFVKLQNVNPGFNPGGVLSMRLSANFSRYTQPQQYKTLGDGILSNVGSVPGVESAGLASNFPFNPTRLATGPANVRFAIEGQPDSATQLAMVVDRNAVSSGYFMTVGQPLLRGRRFTEHDDAQALPVAVINQTMARHRWPEQDPIGKRVSFNQGTSWIEVVGVVGDVKEYGLDRSIRDEVYVPLAQAGGFTGNLVVRTAGDPVAIWPAVRAALRAVDPQLAVDRMSTIESLREESIASPRVTTIMLGLFAGLALLISAGGIGALIALMVSRRTNEIGIRMALGASRASLLFMLLRQGLALALAGTLVGIAGAAALTKLMSTLLYDTSPTDITTFAAISVLFVTVALVACLIPARQITRIDPLIALRQE